MNRKIIPSDTQLSIVMPCLNEAETLAACIKKAHKGAKESGVANYEIIVSDNGSTDGSQEIAEAEGAIVVHAPIRGYGAALQAGIDHAKGKYVIMGDSDESYDWSQISPFMEKLREGHQLVMGTRIKGDIKPDAMPFLHRYLGTPVLTFLGNLFFGSRLSDFNCGMRGFEREAIKGLSLLSPGMEFASEMVIRGRLAGLSMTEIPISYYPDGRTRAPYLQTWRDGWRHLNFMLIFSPRWLFLYPGVFALILGFVGGLVLLPGPIIWRNITFDVHSLLFFGTLLVSGSQLIIFALFARIYAAMTGYLGENEKLQRFEAFISRGPLLIFGILFAVLGGSLFVYEFLQWQSSSFGVLDYQITLRVIIPGMVLVILGLQMVFSSFLFPILNLGKKVMRHR